MASLGDQHKLECRSMVVTLHTLFDIPRDLASLDPRRESVELVLKPTAKYYLDNKRFCKLDLPEQHVAFSPSSIIFKCGRFVMDFDSASKQCGLSMARSTTPRRSASFANSAPNNLRDTVVGHSLPTATGVASSTGKVPLHFEGEAYPCGLSSHKPQPAFIESVENDHDTNLRSPSSLGLRTLAPTSASAPLPNQIVLRYPTRSDLKVILEVMVGARQRRPDSSAVRWITPSWADPSIAGAVTTFAAADGELIRYKIVNRFVGLTVGHLSCTMELPYANEDLREVAAFSPTAIADAAERLCDDVERLGRLYTTATTEDLKTLCANRSTRFSDFVEQLSAGISEATIYRNLLQDVCPDLFIRRVRRVCSMYHPAHQSSPCSRMDADAMIAEYAGRELTLIRILCSEFGPDMSATSPRHRFLSYTYVQTFGDELRDRIRAKFPQQESNILDYEPDVFMEWLVQEYGTQEPSPALYGFPEISYQPDKRAYFCDSLRFPVNREHHRYRDEAMAARQTRVPLQRTPCERPLHPIRPTTRNVGEIDILLEKYKPEFIQIVPSIADAMECVTQHNERLLRELLRECQASGGANPAGGSTPERTRSLPYEVCPNGFQMFQCERPSGSYVAPLTRFAEYTYISASTLLSSVIYLDRLCLRHPRLLLTTRNIEKLLVAAVRVASKVLDLRSVNNKNFASVFSVPVQDMNELESQFIKLMNFDFFLSPKEFENYAHLVQLPTAYMQMPSSVRLPNPVNMNTNARTNGQSPKAVVDQAGQVEAAGHGCNGTASRATSNTSCSDNNGMSLNTPGVTTPAPPRAPSPQSQQQGGVSHGSRGALTPGGSSCGEALVAVQRAPHSEKLESTADGSTATESGGIDTHGGSGISGNRCNRIKTEVSGGSSRGTVVANGYGGGGDSSGTGVGGSKLPSDIASSTRVLSIP